MTTVTSTRLADGRELIYFDAHSVSAALRQSFVDRRTPGRTPGGSTVRYDTASGEWVAVAVHRQGRTHLPAAVECPLCPSTAERPTEIPASDYEVVVFENRYSSFDAGAGHLPVPGALDAAFTSAPAHGRCEVIVFGPHHAGSFGTLGFEQARTVVDAWAHRTATLSALPGVQQVFCFENRGADVGVTLLHPHGQIYAYPFIPPRSRLLAERAEAYYDDAGGRRTMIGGILAAEQADGDRMVLEGRYFSAYVPFAARWPIEVHLAPHRHVPDIAALTPGERDEMTELYLKLLRGLDGLYDSPTPYIAAWYQAPLEPRFRRSSRLHLQLTSPRRAEGKLKFLAGSEAAMGAFINDVQPEEIAERLRRSIAHVR